MAENTNAPSTGRTNAFQDALGINPGPWTKERVINDVKNAGANVLWGAKDWGDAGRNLGGAFSGKDTEGKSLGVWDRVKKGAAGVGDAALGALSVASTAALAVPVVGELAKGATVAAQAAKAAKAGTTAVKAAEATKAGGSAVSGLKPGGNPGAVKPPAPSAVKGNQFPKDELFALTSQIKRSAISIPSNISEGAARESNKEFLRFLFIAQGSISELDTQLLIANNLNFLSKADYIQISEKLVAIRKMLAGLIKFRKAKPIQK